MPKRGEQNEPKEVATKKTATENTTAKPATTQKFVVEERVKKFLAEIDPKFPDFINDTLNQEVTDKVSKEKTSVCFMAFSPNGKEDEAIDDEFNVKCIKDILFHYHTAEEKVKSGKHLMIEVLPPTPNTDEPTMICFHEVS